jgi:BASS family bile acid:Na+ symporter
VISFRKACLAIAGVGLVLALVGLAVGRTALWQPGAVVFVLGLAIGMGAVSWLKPYQFTAWILVALVAPMIYPAYFLHAGGFDMRNKWVMLIAIQLVMFGMGTQMRLADFAGVVKSPHGVVVGIVCHFSVMPLVGLALTKIFRFEPEIAAGVILIGSCSSGLASNVMAYLAKSNLALSVTVTAVTTLLAPLLTPLWMKLLAGTLVEVKFFNMMLEIVKIVLVPVGAALLHDYLRHASRRGRRVTLAMAAFSAVWLAFLALGGWDFLSANLGTGALAAMGMAGFLLSTFVIGAAYHGLTKWFASLDELMPTVAMAGIIYVTAMTTAAGAENLMRAGVALFVAAMLHNTAGYFFGYYLSRASGLEKNSARSIAFEVGLQNGGMASGLASAMGKLGTVGLAAAVFIPWMNISGSLLANYWRKRPVK